MKVLQSSIFRAVCSIIIGVMLIQYPDNTLTWLTVAIGVLFLLSGAISCAAYLNGRRNVPEYRITDADGNVVAGRPAFPLVGLGSLILGLLLAVSPGMFVVGLMYVLGAILILGALSQFVALVNARRYATFSFVFWICPSIVLLTGLFVIVKPMESASLPLVILGWCSLLYGITEIVNSVKIYSGRRRLEQRGGGNDRSGTAETGGM